MVWWEGPGLSEGRRWLDGSLLMRSPVGLTFPPCPAPHAGTVVTCTKHTYRCHNGLCLSKTNPECDGKKDCSDGSDEKNCGEQARRHRRFTVRAQAEAESARAPHTHFCPGCCLEERMTLRIC